MFTADACDNAAMTAYGDVFPCWFVKVKRTNDLTSRGLLEPRHSFGDTTHLNSDRPCSTCTRQAQTSIKKHVQEVCTFSICFVGVTRLSFYTQD